jgi:hypothetical protein
MFRVQSVWFVDCYSFFDWMEIVVYPSSVILCMLMSDCCMCGIMSASLAFDVNHLKSNDVFIVVCIVSPLGRWTVFYDCSSFGKFNSLLAKSHVAPESITNRFSCCFSILCVHLFVLATGCGCLDMTAFISSCSSSVSLILCRSGAK